ncbi:hypothetical protein [Paenibacillus sp. GCM10027626]|uniref:preprotein translocase subunit SecA n=1 Tax=Paenibacillus sp. GCM10027626 TaxID=3273411 RepID=UPI00362FE8B6
MRQILHWKRWLATKVQLYKLRKYKTRLATLEQYRTSELTAQQIALRAEQLKEQVRQGELQLMEDPDEAYALAIAALKIVKGIELYEMQIVAGMAMGEGLLIEMGAGEGKTFAAVLPVYAHALSGKGVHVWTCNDYLARRDATNLAPVYEFLGLSAAYVQADMTTEDKRAAYAADITYVSVHEAGFDYLKDAIRVTEEERLQRPLYSVLIDEIDAVLLDDAASSLVLSAPCPEAAEEDPQVYTELAKQLQIGQHYRIDAREKRVYLLEAGIAKAERQLGCGSLFDEANAAIFNGLMNSLHALALVERDVHYIVREDKIHIIDPLTGRPSARRKWPYPLQAEIERREGVPVSGRGRIWGMMTIRDLLSLYPYRSGMTATARSAADEFRTWYGMNVVALPSAKPCRRVDRPVQIFEGRQKQEQEVIKQTAAAHACGQPVLLCTATVQEAKRLSGQLQASNIACTIITAAAEEAEAAAMEQAGRFGAVTVSAKMAGRGIDIRLGGNSSSEAEHAEKAGGLLVIGTELSGSERHTAQLRGRAGRHGEPGASMLMVSTDDELFKRFAAGGLASRRQLAHLQRVAYGWHAAMRDTLFCYSDLQEQQRRAVMCEREQVLKGNWQPAALLQDNELASEIEKWAALDRRIVLQAIDQSWSEHLEYIAGRRDSIFLESIGGIDPLELFQQQVHEHFLGFWQQVAGRLADEEKKGPALQRPAELWTTIINIQAVPRKESLL